MQSPYNTHTHTCRPCSRRRPSAMQSPYNTHTHMQAMQSPSAVGHAVALSRPVPRAGIVEGLEREGRARANSIDRGRSYAGQHTEREGGVPAQRGMLGRQRAAWPGEEERAGDEDQKSL